MGAQVEPLSEAYSFDGFGNPESKTPAHGSAPMKLLTIFGRLSPSEMAHPESKFNT